MPYAYNQPAGGADDGGEQAGFGYYRHAFHCCRTSLHVCCAATVGCPPDCGFPARPTGKQRQRCHESPERSVLLGLSHPPTPICRATTSWRAGWARLVSPSVPASSIISAMPPLSAGLLLYRRRQGHLEVLLVHPGGPFNAGRDAGIWSIPRAYRARRGRSCRRRQRVRGGDRSAAGGAFPSASRRALPER